MAKMKWTPQQQQAISARGGTLLVSAGAGSGKTAVLTERVVQRIFDPENPVDADRMLIVTYTRAAAAEMRQRISAKLTHLLEEDPKNRALRRQLMLLEKAHISTVHAFCQELIRQNFQRLEVDPDFRLADDKELEIWQHEAASQVIEAFYEAGDPVFLELVELLSTTRDDSMLEETVLRLYSFIRSHPFYDEWLDQKLAMYQGITNVCDSPWGRIILEDARRTVQASAARLAQARELCFGDEKLMKAYQPSIEAGESQLLAILELIDKKNWNALRGALQSFSMPPFGRLVKYTDTVRKARISGCRDLAKKAVAELAEKRFCASEEEFLEDIADLFPKVQQLFELTRQFDRRLTKVKADHRALDFSDLEHLALRLLVERDPETGERRPTDYAAEIASGFDQVYVDEYQDTNEVQDMIFRAVSDHEENLFLVGDVKQSIYRFRQAMPEIFLARKASYAPCDGVHWPARLDLSVNFRSRTEITDGINELFEMLMSREMGEIDYRSGEQLVAGASYPPAEGPFCQVHVLDVSELGQAMTPVEAEARYVAAQIAKLLRERTPVRDGDEMRPIRPGDICILMRAPKNKALIYREALAREGVDSLAEAQRGYLSSREISSVVSLLRVVDNPLQDVELAAAMMSPIFSFTPDEMGAIRNLDHRVPLYLAVRQRAEEGDGRCSRFLEILEELRLAASSLSADRLLMRLYDITGVETIVRTMEAGDLRVQNLRLLIQHAADYEERGYRGLSGLLAFLDRLAQRGGDLTESSSVVDTSESVTIMSIHKSKGLEFPVVFLADSAKGFNTMDQHQPVLLHSTLGFACQRRDFETFRQYSTLPMEALKIDMERSTLSEELRMLYVALTRAKERFFITGTVKNLPRKLSGLDCALEDGRLPSWHTADGKSYLDWVLAALIHHPDGWELCHEAGIEADLTPRKSRFGVVITALDEAGEEEEDRDRGFTAREDPELLKLLEERTAFRYPYEEATVIPTKLAVSELSEKVSYEGGHFTSRPAFLCSKGLTPAEKGSALHRFMQFCNYEQAAADPEQEIRRMTDLGFLSEAERQVVDPQAIGTFFRSPLAERIFSAQAVHREYRFLAEVGEEVIGRYAPMELGGCRTTLQGVADCIFIEDGEAVIVDYKTDRTGDPQALADRYRVQLELYRELVSQSLGLPVKECLLYSFAMGREIRVS